MARRLPAGSLYALQGMAGRKKGVQVIADEAHQRVDITIDGKPFTSYVWPVRSRSRYCFH